MLYFSTFNHKLTLLFMIVLFPLKPEKYHWNDMTLLKFSIYFYLAQLLTTRRPNLDVYETK